jgi:cytochrome c553
VRQLYDFQHGTRAGPWSPLMAPNVIKLTLYDMVALAAYAASLPPKQPSPLEGPRRAIPIASIDDVGSGTPAGFPPASSG